MKKLSLVLALLLLSVGVAPLSSHAAWSNYRIMLDPGHGGSDPGASGPSAPHEAELALRCCNAMVSWIKGTGGSSSYRMTRTGNTTLSLSARRSASISYDPYIFCSVHLNAFNGSANGTETWYYFSAGNSSKLASKVQSQLVAKLGRVNRGVKQNGWTVITGSSTIPAILTEGLFVDNRTEWGMINNTSNAGFKNWVNGHLMGFYSYLTGQGYSLNANPDSNPYGGGGGTVTNPDGSISVASGLHFTGYVGDEPELDLVITGKNMNSNITITSNYGARFLVNNTNAATNPVSIPAAGGTVKVKFADPYKNNIVGKYGKNGIAQNEAAVISGTSMWLDFKLTITGTDKNKKTVTKTVALSGELKARPLAPAEKWNLSEQKNNKTSKGYDASKIRNFVYNNGKLYCVYDQKDILVLNAQTGDKLGFLKRGGIVKGGILQLCDVKVIDNVVVACNIGDSKTPLRVYAWKDDNANPELILETTDMQGAARVGDCMELAGQFNGSLWLTFGAVKDGATSETRVVEYNRNGANWTSKYTNVYISAGKFLSTMATVRAYPKNGNYWIDGKDSYPSWTVADATAGGVVRKTYVDTGESWGSSHHEFNYGGQKYSANLVFNSKEYNKDGSLNNDVNYKGARMRVIADLSGDFTRIQQIGDYPSAGLGSVSRNTNATGDIMINTDGSTYWEGWVTSTTHGIAYYAHGSVPAKNPAKLELQEPEVDQPAGPTMSVDKTSVSLLTEPGKPATAQVKVTAANIKGDIAVSITGDAAFTVAEDKLSGSGTLNITYTSQTEGSHNAEITLSAADVPNIKIALTGKAEKTRPAFTDVITKDKLEEVWIYSPNHSMGDWHTTTDYTRSIAFLNDKLYVLISKPFVAPKVFVIDAYTGQKVGELSTEGISGGWMPMSSLFVIDGKLYGNNIARTSDVFKVYRWDNDSAKPACVLEDATHQGIEFGGKVSFIGNGGNGKIYSYDASKAKLASYPVTNGNIGSTASVLALTTAAGKEFTTAADAYGSADVVDNGDGTFWIVSKDVLPTRFGADGKAIENVPGAAVNDVRFGSAMRIMPFGSKKYAAFTLYKDGVALTNGQMSIVDVTGGLPAAGAPVATLPEAGLGTTKNDHFQTQILHSYRAENKVLDMWTLVAKQGVAHYKFDPQGWTGISNVGIDAVDPNAPVEFFNLQGVKVNSENLAPGIYIRRQGKHADKVLVK